MKNPQKLLSSNRWQIFFIQISFPTARVRCTAKTRYVSCSLHSPIHSGSCANSPLQGSNMRPPSLLERSSLRNLTIVFCVHITTLGSGVSVTHNRKQLFSISSAFHIQPDHMTSHRIVISCSNLLESYAFFVCHYIHHTAPSYVFSQNKY